MVGGPLNLVPCPMVAEVSEAWWWSGLLQHVPISAHTTVGGILLNYSQEVPLLSTLSLFRKEYCTKNTREPGHSASFPVWRKANDKRHTVLHEEYHVLSQPWRGYTFSLLLNDLSIFHKGGSNTSADFTSTKFWHKDDCDTRRNYLAAMFSTSYISRKNFCNGTPPPWLDNLGDAACQRLKAR